MKAKTIILMLTGFVASALAVSAQDASSTTPDAAQNSAEVADAPATEPAATAPAEPQAEAAPASTDSTTVADATPAVSPDPESAPQQTTPAPVVAQTEPVPAAPVETAAPAPAEPPAVAAPVVPIIPLIVMDDVPLTDAIKNLARQASLNYMLDPKITFGQTGPDGKPVPQPSVSIRWENVTATQALHALLANYGLQLVEDPKTKIARITTQDPAAPPPLITKIVKLNYASPSNMMYSVQSAFTDKRSKVIPDVRSSQLVLVATEKELDDVSKLIETLDSPTRQVLIQARIMETSLNPNSLKGINWAGTLQGQHLAFGNNLNTPSGGSLPSDTANATLSQSFPKMLFDTAHGFSPATAFLDADGVNAVLSFLNTDNKAKTLATPHAVTVDNEMASLEVVQQFPVINITAGTANTTGGSSISYTNVGVKLKVTPHISANNFVNLKVFPEISSHEKDIEFSISAGSLISVPVFNSRTIETTVLIPSGNTLVLGGLVSDNLTATETKVPLLGDIPGLGRAFRHDSKNRQKTDLLIFITPTIIKDSDFQVDEDNFLHTPVAVAKEPVWDSKHPYDWSAEEGKKN